MFWRKGAVSLALLILVGVECIVSSALQEADYEKHIRETENLEVAEQKIQLRLLKGKKGKKSKKGKSSKASKQGKSSKAFKQGKKPKSGKKLKSKGMTPATAPTSSPTTGAPTTCPKCIFNCEGCNNCPNCVSNCQNCQNCASCETDCVDCNSHNDCPGQGTNGLCQSCKEDCGACCAHAYACEKNCGNLNTDDPCALCGNIRAEISGVSFPYISQEECDDMNSRLDEGEPWCEVCKIDVNNPNFPLTIPLSVSKEDCLKLARDCGGVVTVLAIFEECSL